MNDKFKKQFKIIAIVSLTVAMIGLIGYAFVIESEGEEQHLQILIEHE